MITARRRSSMLLLSCRAQVFWKSRLQTLSLLLRKLGRAKAMLTQLIRAPCFRFCPPTLRLSRLLMHPLLQRLSFLRLLWRVPLKMRDPHSRFCRRDDAGSLFVNLETLLICCCGNHFVDRTSVIKSLVIACCLLTVSKSS